jgi:hypothetical protein
MKLTAITALLVFLGVASPHPEDSTSLTFERTITLTGVTGKFDHFAIDEAGNRLFAAATGNQTVEIIDLATGKSVQSVSGFGKPHGLAWVRETGRLFVADGSNAELDVLEGSPLKVVKKIALSEDADDMVYDGMRRVLYVGHGGTNAQNPAGIAVIDAVRLTVVRTIPVAAHPEALDIDPVHDRIFANISERGEVAVIDGKRQAIIAKWPLANAKGNTPMAYDAADNILLIGCRTPAKLIALDATSGKELATAPADAGADDLFYEPRTHRAYLITGSGVVDSYTVTSERTLQGLAPTSTASGAKTGLLVPLRSSLYVGIPGSGDAAQIRIYRTAAK